MTAPTVSREVEASGPTLTDPVAGRRGAPGMAVSAGVITGLDLLSRAFAFALLAFSGPLAAGLDAATVLFVGSCVLATALGLGFSDGDSVFGAVQSAPLVVLLPALAVAPDVSTAFAILGGSAIATGAAMALMARFDAGRLVRLLPYPVIAGFLAAAGALMILAAVKMIVPNPVEAITAPGAALTGDRAITLGLALAFAGALRTGAALRPDFGSVVALVLGIGAFFLVLDLSGIGVSGAREAGLLSPPPSAAGAGTGPGLAFWAEVDLGVLREALPLMAAAVFIGLLGHLLNVSGIELGLKREVRASRALAGTGAVNLLTGVLGCAPSFVSSTSTLIARHLGGRSRVSGIVACAVLVGGIAIRHDVIALAPRFVPAGLLLFVGYEILDRWFLGEARQQSRQDLAIIGGLVLATLILGVLPAILVGILLSCLFFAVNYARLETVRGLADLSVRRSAVDRGPAETAALDRASGRVATVTLQGYLFFGSVDKLVAPVRTLLEGQPPVRQVVLDCASVSGIDSAAVATFQKLEYLASAHGAEITIAGLSSRLANAVSRQGVGAAGTALRLAASADAALQAAEAQLIREAGITEDSDDARSALVAACGDAQMAAFLLDRMERLEIAEGATLVEMGSGSSDVFVVDKGRIAVIGRRSDGTPFRIRSFRPGAVLGEIAFYLQTPRTADLIAEAPSVAYRLGPDVLADLARSNPAALTVWHRIAAQTLADKLSRTNELLREASS
ncbi:SulP family sulfate permease [Aliiruegeria haliotis]|uniref:SulP family sulfate permease n=1 Tax=Aliiruegeria haliotis TaxID=1280846 RepID=A0A2T0RY72_9RHOB|nr:SulP family inorganic anion transporter [Aliiruegeria haliotis]PRY26121.1 SulP family sulfate permease [Aliiruegeria haliotis]